MAHGAVTSKSPLSLSLSHTHIHAHTNTYLAFTSAARTNALALGESSLSQFLSIQSLELMAFHSDLRLWFIISLSTLVSVWFIQGSLKAFWSLWWTPRHFRRLMERQGIKGPPQNFLVGNSPQIFREKADAETFIHDHVSRLLDYYAIWSKIYGKRHLFWWGCEPRLVVTELELLKQVHSPKNALVFGKSHSIRIMLEPLMGRGLVTANGEVWAHQRKLIAPAFRFDELKGLAGDMITITENMLEMWDSRLRHGNGKAEIEVSQELKRLTADVIAKTQFGSNYEKGRIIFQDLDRLNALVVRFDALALIPGGRFFPTPSNLQKWKLKRDIERRLKEIVQERQNWVMQGQNNSYGADLLGLMLAGSHTEAADRKKLRLTIQELMDNCKTFFFAGHDTTANLLAWTVLLLAAYPRWQERAREEVNNVCEGSAPDANRLNELKVLGMILYETMRLYPGVIATSREAQADTTLGDLLIPKGMCLWIPILAIHVDPELWGKDATEFNPERFAGGIGKACKHPMAFQPFGLGPRQCVGQNFAIMEAKIVMAMLLSRFQFKLSPNYRHAPQTVLILQPKYGAHVIVEKLHPN